MRYTSERDGQMMRRASVGPAASIVRRRLRVYVPDRGASPSLRYLRGFGTLTQAAGSVVQGASVGASVAASPISAAVGSALGGTAFAPVIGTAIGLIVGLVASGVFNHRVDPEVGNFNNAMQLYASNPQAIYNIADKYLVLAGMFDLEPGQVKGHIPIYIHYGRMGEEKLVDDFMNRIYNAAQAGQITGNDTPASVMARIIQPYINSWGLGPMVDHNADMINEIMIGLIAEYVTGLWNQRWFARSGDLPHFTFPAFSLPGGATQQAPTAAPQGAPTLTPRPAAPLVSPVGSVITVASGQRFTTRDGVWSASPDGNYLLNGHTTGAAGPPLFPQGTYQLRIGPVGQVLADNPDGSVWSWNGHTFIEIQPGTAAPAAPPTAMPFQIEPGSPQNPGVDSGAGPYLQRLPEPAYLPPSGGGGGMTSPSTLPVEAPPPEIGVSSYGGVPMWVWLGGGGLLLLILTRGRRA